MNGILCSRTRLCALVLLMACAMGWVGATNAQPPPTAGSLLVAKRGQPGIFSHSVVLLIAYGPGGAMGVIVNRPTKFPLAKALPGVNGLQGRNNPLYFGGPVSLSHVTLLIRSKTAPPGAVHVVDDVYASVSMKTLRAIMMGKFAGAPFRGYAGYAGWAPGQLDAEIARGGWLVLPVNADDVFTIDPIGLWNKLIQRQNLILVRAHQPVLYGTGLKEQSLPL